MEFCNIIGAPHLAAAEKFKTNRGRVENRSALLVFLEPLMKTRNSADWVAACEIAAVPCGPINTLDQVFTDSQVLARGMQIGLTRDDGVQVPGIANPIVFSATPNQYDRPPPLLGENTSSVLKALLGLSDDTLEGLKLSRTIA